MSIPATTTLRIATEQWTVAITGYLVEHGNPVQVVPAQAAPVDADEVHWVTSTTELRCIKIALVIETKADGSMILHNPNFPDA